MIKYRGTYRIFMPMLSDQNCTTPNLDDTYIRSKSKKSTICRYNSDTLVVYFSSTGYANNRLKELKEVGVQLTLFQQGDQESTYLFPESQLPIVAKIIDVTTWGAKKSPRVFERKIKRRELTKEEKQVLAERLAKARAVKKNSVQKG